ncbi:MULTISPECIES: ABC transporter permease [Ramlibacter]|uniref:ABC transporter permease n=1 Tax=Ramlibacter aquaticus TaxID=2780094 RepID=A0ABR9SIA0_9BURK|nr:MULTISPECIES: ABC transporter permease [Ramlibacter]MBE7942033.1 ABC transporter permease [Ramlibacter aquaticus]
MISPELAAVFLGSSLRLAAPLLFSATGELVSERAGVLNMSVEGMMLAGAFAGAAGSWATGSPGWGLVAGVLCVLPIAWLQAFLSITLRANQIVTGIGINILVLGATTLGYRALFGSRSRAEIPGLDKWAPPGLDAIPWLGDAVFRQAWLLYAGVLLVIAVGWTLRHTALGLALHAAGTAPQAAANSGLPVNRIRYGAVLFTGFMAALAGCFLSIGDIHTFTEGMTGGAGYLAIAAVIFGNWKLGRTLFACGLFGAATALQFQLPGMGVEVPSALLIMLPYVLALLAVGGLVGRQVAPAALTQPYVGH